jgi:hypothetical protein
VQELPVAERHPDVVGRGRVAEEHEVTGLEL